MPTLIRGPSPQLRCIHSHQRAEMHSALSGQPPRVNLEFLLTCF